jgi:hypothetical protein
VVEQTVTLQQGSPKTLTLANWNGHGSASGAGCGAQGPWSTPHSYIVQAASLGGNPSNGALDLVAPGEPLIQPTPSTAPTASTTARPSASATGSASAKPKPKAKPTATATATTSVWN